MQKKRAKHTWDYKSMLREAASERRRRGYPATMRRLAERVGMQHTYFSKVLNTDSKHLSEDQLYGIARELGMFAHEIETLMLIRSHAMTSNPTRRHELAEVIETRRAQQSVHAEFRVSESPHGPVDESAYLLDPINVIVHVAMDVPGLRENPRTVAAALGLTLEQLQMRLRLLETLGFLELSPDGRRVLANRKQAIHYGKDHPLMRHHQAAIRQLSAAQAYRLPEELRHAFMVTFSTDATGRRRVRELFDRFLADLQKALRDRPNTEVCQLNFEIFRWLNG